MIEIRLDGKPVTKLEAARALAVPGRTRAFIGEPNEFGVVHDSVTVYGRYPAYGAVEPPALNCASFIAGTAAEIRQRAEMIALAAEVAELAEMIAAEQDAQQPAATLTPEREPCEEREWTTTGPDKELDRALYCDKQAGHAGNHHAAVSDVSGGFEVAWPNPCGARPYPAGSEGDDGTVCTLPVGHDGPHDDGPPELETTGVGVRLAVCGRHIAMDAYGRCDACDEGKAAAEQAGA